MAKNIRFYANDHLVTELTSLGKIVYFRCESLPLATQRQDTSEKGTVLFGTDRSDTILLEMYSHETECRAYTPYGYSPFAEQYLLAFNGERLEHSGFYLLGRGYRAFSPALMKFLRPDSYSPTGPGGINSFAYGLGDPVNLFDPSGRFSEAIMLKINAWAARAKLRTMFTKANAANIYIDNVAQTLGKIYGASWLPAPQKTWDRAWEKTQSKYAGDPTRLKDIARNTLVAKKKVIPEIVSTIEQMGGKYKYIDSSTDPLGYTGINAVLPTPNGLWAEIQIIPKRMAYAKYSPEISPTTMSARSYNRIHAHAESLGLIGGAGHKYYRIFRDAASSIRDKEAAARKSREYYGALVNFNFQRTTA